MGWGGLGGRVGVGWGGLGGRVWGGVVLVVECGVG